jgi:hypothetical protein
MSRTKTKSLQKRIKTAFMFFQGDFRGKREQSILGIIASASQAVSDRITAFRTDGTNHAGIKEAITT